MAVTKNTVQVENTQMTAEGEKGEISSTKEDLLITIRTASSLLQPEMDSLSPTLLLKMELHIVLTLTFAITAHASLPTESSTMRSDDSQTTDTGSDISPQANRGPDVEILIEENLQKSLVNEDAAEFGSDGVVAAVYDDVIHRDPDETMETAAGFAPLPFLKKRRKTQRPYATRRFYQKPHANRRFQYFYPYYYGFYPSSLRYFKYY